MKPPKSGNFKAVTLPKPQTTVARCFGVIDIGTIDNTYPGQETKKSRVLYIMWELPKLLAIFDEEKGEQPFMVGEFMTFSTNEKSNFSKLISSWRNKPIQGEEKFNFDPLTLLNKICLLSFIHKRKAAFKDARLETETSETTILALNGVSSVPSELKETMPKRINALVSWDWDAIEDGEETFNVEKFALIPKFIRKKIYTSEEFHACPDAVNIDSNETAEEAQVDDRDQQQDPEITGDDWE